MPKNAYREPPQYMSLPDPEPGPTSLELFNAGLRSRVASCRSSVRTAIATYPQKVPAIWEAVEVVAIMAMVISGMAMMVSAMPDMWPVHPAVYIIFGVATVIVVQIFVRVFYSNTIAEGRRVLVAVDEAPPVVDEWGTKRWRKNGKLHRDDGPAVEYEDGYKEWRRNGFLHRDGGPAIEYADGGKEWWINSRFIRDESP